MKQLLLLIALISMTVRAAVPTTVEELEGTYEAKVTMKYLKANSAANNYEWDGWQYDGTFKVNAGKKPDTIEIEHFPFPDYKAVGTVDFEKGTIYFPVQEVYSSKYFDIDVPEKLFEVALGSKHAPIPLQVGEDRLRGVTATFGDNGKICVKDWTYGSDYSEYYADNKWNYEQTISLSVTNVSAELYHKSEILIKPGDVSFLLGKYLISPQQFSGEYYYIDKWYDTWKLDAPLEVKVEKYNSINMVNAICMYNFPIEGYKCIGQVDLETGLIYFAPQEAYVDEWKDGGSDKAYALPIFLFSTTEELRSNERGYWMPNVAMRPAMARFQREKGTITIEEWAFANDWGSYFGSTYGGYLWADYRDVKAVMKLQSNTRK